MQPSEMKLRSFQGHEPGWSEQAFQKRRVCSGQVTSSKYTLHSSAYRGKDY